MTLIYLSLFWLAGVLAGSLVRVDPAPALAGSLFLVLIAVVGRRRRPVWLGALCLAVLSLGAVRYQTALPSAGYGSIALHIGPRKVEVGAIVVAEPDVRDRETRLVVDAYHVGSGADSFAVSGKIQVRVPRFSDYRYGDDLLLRGTLLDPPEFDAFSYKRYLLRQGIYAIMYSPRVDVVGRDQGNRLLAALYEFKQRLQLSLVRYLPEPQAGLAQGILLGVKAVMTESLTDDLTRTGLTHIVVVSGYNLTVVAGLLQRLTEKRLRRSLSLLLALAGVIAFTLMTGASVPVVRAAIMVGMAMLARAVGRESDAFTSLLFTAAILIGFHPMTLWDVSFQLSFLATAGLVLLAPPMEGALARLPAGIGAILAATLAAQIMTLPVIALNFERISLVSPLANVLVQPAIPLMMVTGALTAVAGLTEHVAVQFLGWLTWLPGVYATEIMRLLGDVPWAMVDFPTLPADMQTAAVVVYFAAVALAFFAGTHVTRAGLRSLPQHWPQLVRHSWPRLLTGFLAAIALIVWIAVLLLVRQSPP